MYLVKQSREFKEQQKRNRNVKHSTDRMNCWRIAAKIRDRAFDLQECGEVQDGLKCNELADKVSEKNYALIAATAKLRFGVKV